MFFALRARSFFFFRRIERCCCRLCADFIPCSSREQVDVARRRPVTHLRLLPAGNAQESRGCTYHSQILAPRPGPGRKVRPSHEVPSTGHVPVSALEPRQTLNRTNTKRVTVLEDAKRPRKSGQGGPSGVSFQRALN
jgi:hypothetical protein